MFVCLFVMPALLKHRHIHDRVISEANELPFTGFGWHSVKQEVGHASRNASMRRCSHLVLPLPVSRSRTLVTLRRIGQLILDSLFYSFINQSSFDGRCSPYRGGCLHFPRTYLVISNFRPGLFAWKPRLTPPPPPPRPHISPAMVLNSGPGRVSRKTVKRASTCYLDLQADMNTSVTELVLSRKLPCIHFC